MKRQRANEIVAERSVSGGSKLRREWLKRGARDTAREHVYYPRTCHTSTTKQLTAEGRQCELEFVGLAFWVLS